MTAKSTHWLSLRTRAVAAIGLAACLVLPAAAEAQGGGPSKCSPKALLKDTIPLTITFFDLDGDGNPISGITDDGRGSYGPVVKARIDCDGNISMANFVDFESTGRTLTFDFNQEVGNDGSRCENDCKAGFTEEGIYSAPFGWFNVRPVDATGNVVSGGAICMAQDDPAPAKLKVSIEGREQDPDVSYTVAFNPFQTETPGYELTNAVKVTRTGENTWLVEAPESTEWVDGAPVGPVGNLRAAKFRRTGPTNEGNYKLRFLARAECQGDCICPK